MSNNSIQNKDELLEKLLSSNTQVIEQDFLNSSSLVSGKYDKISKTLTIKFKSSLDAAYLFYDVPEEIVLALFSAKSSGAYFSKELKGKFLFTKLALKKKKEEKETK